MGKVNSCQSNKFREGISSEGAACTKWDINWDQNLPFSPPPPSYKKEKEKYSRHKLFKASMNLNLKLDKEATKYRNIWSKNLLYLTGAFSSQEQKMSSFMTDVERIVERNKRIQRMEQICDHH